MKAASLELLQRGAAEMGLTIVPEQLNRFSALADELVKWNRKINLTAIATEKEIVVKHFLDSLTAVRVLNGTGRLLDIGSGGGFPALPLKIFHPELSVVAVDAVEKKIIFQRQAARLLGLSDFTALHARAETLSTEHGRSFDWVISRAFADLPTFVAMAAPLVKLKGLLVAMKGREGAAEAAEAAPALLGLGVRVCDVLEFSLPVNGDRRSLVVMTLTEP